MDRRAVEGTRWWLRMGLAWILLVIGTLLASGMSAYVVTGPDRVSDASRSQGEWRLRGDRGGVAELIAGGGVHLISHEGQRAVAWRDVGLLGDHPQWRVRARVKAPRPARVQAVLAATDGDRKLWFGSYGFESDVYTTVELPVHAPLAGLEVCLLYTSPSPRDGLLSRMPSSA